LDRTLACTSDYAQIITDCGAERIRFVATSATRDVSNREVLLDGVRERLGVEVDIISGDEEARLSFDGATRGLDEVGSDAYNRPWVVVDIGGGSTELVTRVGDFGRVVGQSLDVGSVRMTERHLATDPPRADEIAAARATIRSALDTLTVDLGEVGTLVGVAGTITTVAALVLELPTYDRSRVHHSWISTEALGATVERLLAMTTAQRRELPSMHPGRADVIAGGVVVLQEVVARVGVNGVLVSEHDILDGIAWSMA
jgi:exopolyphosphatase/guanosine-5'-triphosphate,3'-diphosphate pyrophosphatase